MGAVLTLYEAYSGAYTLKTCGCNNCHGLSGWDACLKQAMPQGEEREQGEQGEKEFVIYTFSSVVTMNPSWPRAKCVGTYDGRIIVVGDSIDDMQPWLRRASLVGIRSRVERCFETRVCYPGFVEPHSHPLIGGTALSLPCVAYHTTPNPFGEAIPGCKNKADVLKRLREEETKLKLSGSDEDLIAWGWDSVAMGGDLTRKDLDQISQERVITVWDCSMHNSFCNTKALEKVHLEGSGIWTWWNRRKASRLPGVKFDSDGNLTGVFLGLDATYLLISIFQQLFKVRRMLEAMHYLTELGRQNGITTMAEMYLGVFALPMELRLFSFFYNSPNTPMRVVCTIAADKAVKFFGGIWGRTSLAVDRVMSLQKTSTAKVIFNGGVKFFCDDAFFSLTMQVDFPGYCDGHSGIWNLAPGQTMFLKMLPWWKAGARIHVHSNGDAAQDATLHSLAALQTKKPRFDHRFCFEHFGCSNEALVRRVKMLGANVSVNPYYPHLRAKLNTERLGIDRASATSNFRLIKDNGITVASHTDTPVAPPRPLEEVWIACNRFCEDSEEVIAPAERITVQEALRMKTCDAAHVIGLDALIGSIEAGKMADFTVLSEDPQEIPKVKIRDVRVCATVVDGRISKEGWKLPCASEIPEGFWGGFLWLFKQTSPKHSWSRWFWASLLNLFNLFN